MTTDRSVALSGVNVDQAQVDRARASTDLMRENDRASATLGIRTEVLGPGHAVSRMRVGEEMLNGHGMAHGGLLFTLADTAFAFACNTDGQVTVARQCEISFLRPAQRGDELIAEAIERARAGRSGIYDVRVTRQDGDVIAELRGHSATLAQRGGA